MAIVTLCYVICDVCGKPGNEPTDGPVQARHFAEGNGFTHASADGRGRRRADYCPAHKPTEKEPS